MKAALFFAFVLMLVMVGCAPQRTPVGKWDLTIEVQGQKYPAVVDIKADGTTSSLITLAMPMGDVKVDTTGTWKSDGKTLTMTVTDIKAAAGSNELVQGAIDMAKPALMKQLGVARTANLKYMENGEMETITDEGIVTTYKPHKEA